MIATLAATAQTSGLEDQKQLLHELEKKVEEQKKFLEMRKVNIFWKSLGSLPPKACFVLSQEGFFL